MKDIILQLIIRLINSTECNGFYLLDSMGLFDFSFENNELFLGNVDGKCLKDQILLVTLNENNGDFVLSKINRMKEDNIVIACSEDNIEGFYPLNLPDKKYYIKLFGKLLNYADFPNKDFEFKVLAIVHFYNEEDVIQKTTEYLLSQQVDVYLVDNWSEDASYEIAKSLAKANPGHVFLERFPAEGQRNYYDWYHQLQRTEEISKELDYDWFIHYDADEMRVGPWKNVNLRNTIRYVDSLGYNLIENTVIDFKITDVDDVNIFMTDGPFDFGRRATHFEQTKTWKKTDEIELKTTGGHNAIIDNPHIFPLKILNRHYPLRSLAQAKKKIFMDRVPRFEKEQQERGWHKHYDSIKYDCDLISCRDELLTWDENTFDNYYIQLFTGCGISREENDEKSIDISDIPEGATIAVYGAGSMGKKLVRELIYRCNIVHWVDKNYVRMPKKLCKKIESPEVLKEDKNSYEYIVVAATKLQTLDEIKNTLFQWKIDEGKIIWKTKL